MLNTSYAKMLLNHSLNKKITLYRLLSILIITYLNFFCGCCQIQRHYSLIYHERSQQIIRSEIHMSRTNHKSLTLEHIFLDRVNSMSGFSPNEVYCLTFLF